jgi:hypothetical protein
LGKKKGKKVKLELYLSDGVDPGSYADRGVDEDYLRFLADDTKMMMEKLSDEEVGAEGYGNEVTA